MRKVNPSPVLLLVSVGCLFWAIVLKALYSDFTPTMSLISVFTLLAAIYTEMYYANRK